MSYEKDRVNELRRELRRLCDEHTVDRVVRQLAHVVGEMADCYKDEIGERYYRPAAKGLQQLQRSLGRDPNIRSYVTSWDVERGHVVLADVPLSTPPGRMESDETRHVLRSEMRPDWTWEHVYRDLLDGRTYRMVVREAPEG